MTKILTILIFILSLSSITKSQIVIEKTIDWNNSEITQSLLINNTNNIYISGSYNTNKTNNISIKAIFDSLTYTPVSTNEQNALINTHLSDTTILKTTISLDRKISIIDYYFNPYRINNKTNKIEKVIHYRIKLYIQQKTLKNTNVLKQYATNSLLNTGNWIKIKINKSGVYKITYSQLKELGITKPENIRVYSYGGKQLPYANFEKNFDDLNEIPIKINDGNSILFYADSPGNWYYDNSINMFMHSNHYYSKYTYIFLSDAIGSGGLKIKETDNTNLTYNYTTNSFDSYKYHKIPKYNLIKSGRTWYGEKFKPDNEIEFNFNFQNIINTENAYIYTSVVGRKQKKQTCYFNIYNNNNYLARIDINSTYGHYTYGYEYFKKISINNPSATFNLKYSFNGANANMEGYLNFICINTREKIKTSYSQLTIRDRITISANRITKFDIDNSGKSLTIWDITNKTNPTEIISTTTGNITSFISKTDSLKEFIIFENTNYLTPIMEGDDLGLIKNQNLHSCSNYDMIIITHPKFQKQAEELAEIHRKKDSLSVFITQPQLIYNEFSSGTPDISAIRNFLRMFYDRYSSTNQAPKYLLLFGDGSFDNSSLIPTYQNINSLEETKSHVSDDYYGLLDYNEGEYFSNNEIKINGKLDLGIGRFPVQTEEEAKLMIDKVKNYISVKSTGDWKTNLCFIGDDEDFMTHQKQADYLSEKIVRQHYPEFNNYKIYLDSYNQISTPSGQRYPDVTKAINDQVEKGALIIDYVGHGNPRILAHEEILSTNDVKRWKNKYKLPVFITASCEVGRFDDPERTSLGEWFLLNPNGGGIAAITTTRVVYSGENFELSKSVFKNILKSELRMGDVIRIAKNLQSSISTNHRNFTLLGDPALKISIPKNKIVIGNINKNFLQTENKTYLPGDTINALSKILIEGYIDDPIGNPIYENGVLHITIFDKIDTLKVTANDVGQNQTPDTLTFNIQNRILYKGKASINKGYFKFEFIVPKDINYKFGKGKISLYAVLDSSEAIGYSDNIIIGGNADSIIDDNNGPTIELFMNDTLFKNEGITNENPYLIAKLIDENGINTTGNGFGHNITAILDDNQDNIYILNDYYSGDIDKYNSGYVKYQFNNLPVGYHKITFKAWDIHNNSSESTIEFYVYESKSPYISNMYNTPNPFYNETWFTFEHNQPADNFKVNIKIFDLTGNLVSEINQNNTNVGYAINPIKWDGTNLSGAKLPKGIYVYKVTITTQNNTETYKTSKLMIF